jgi:hypothetical protein
MAGLLHGAPARVRAPQGLSFVFFIPPADYTDHGLAAALDIDSFNRDFLTGQPALQATVQFKLLREYPHPALCAGGQNSALVHVGTFSHLT